MSIQQKTQNYLAIARHFKLGVLPTEQPHPRTEGLAELAKKDLAQAYSVFQSVDQSVVDQVLCKSDGIEKLAHAIRETLDSKNRIFLCGCGATGRLALTLEALWRRSVASAELQERVVSFMAGGDYALIRSIEGFEDHPEYGERQLLELGFHDGDLLISATEGGETPFVIGATEAAALHSRRKPWFLYCNPDEILIQNVERSRKVLENPRIEKLNLYVGRMALSGSTRLQATTALYLAAGSALLGELEGKPAPELIRSVQSTLQKISYGHLSDWTLKEEQLYRDRIPVRYQADELATTVANDLTERAPTFSIPALDPEGLALSAVQLEVLGTQTREQAWEKLLARMPRPLEWRELGGQYGKAALLQFDFTTRPVEREVVLALRSDGSSIQISSEGFSFSLPLGGSSAFERHLILKLLLNAHSTLMMGRLGRYISNVMIFVRPSNFKLIDRSIRSLQWLASNEGLPPQSYEEWTFRLFQELEDLSPDEPAVVKTLNRYKLAQKA